MGVYGVASHNVVARTRAIGIRMAVGARATDVLRIFVRDSLRMTSLGIAIGVSLSAGASTLLASYLFGLKATDGATFAGGSAVLLVVGICATYLPARRAARIDPLVALRHD